MKVKSFLLGLCMSVCATTFAANTHVHPEDKTAKAGSVEKKAAWPGYCEIEIINNSFSDVRVYGTFDDGMPLEPFNVYSFESAHYISLYYADVYAPYYYYCHAGMSLYIDSWSGYHVYSGYTPVKSTVRIVPFLANKIKAELSSK